MAVRTGPWDSRAEVSPHAPRFPHASRHDDEVPSTVTTEKSLLLTMSMRTFDIATESAASAFGPRAAAPRGLYGITALLAGGVSGSPVPIHKFGS